MIRFSTPGTGGVCGAACCLTEPCALTLTYVDENRCEDDAFNVFLKWTDEEGLSRQTLVGTIDGKSDPPGCCGWQDEARTVPCPQTRQDVGFTIALNQVSPCCQVEIALTLNHSNCCGTLATYSLTGPGGTVDSGTFGPGGLTEDFNVRTICNPAP